MLYEIPPNLCKYRVEIAAGAPYACPQTQLYYSINYEDFQH